MTVLTIHFPPWLTQFFILCGFDVDAVLTTINNIISGRMGIKLTVIIIALLVLLGIRFLAQCLILHKAQKGWAWNFVPLVRDYKLLSVARFTAAFWILIALFVLGIGLGALGVNFRMPWLTIASLIIAVMILALSVVFCIVYSAKLSRAFGHGLGYALGLIFLPTLFSLILAFGSSTYAYAGENH